MQCTVAPESTIDLLCRRFGLADFNRRAGGLPVTFIPWGEVLFVSLVSGRGIVVGTSPHSMHEATKIDLKSGVVIKVIRTQSFQRRLRA